MILNFYIMHIVFPSLCAICKTFNIWEHKWPQGRVYNSWTGHTCGLGHPNGTFSVGFVIQCCKISVPWWWQPVLWLLMACFVFVLVCYDSSMVGSPCSFSGTDWALVICIFRWFFISGVLPCSSLLLRSMLTKPWRPLLGSVSGLPRLP